MRYGAEAAGTFFGQLRLFPMPIYMCGADSRAARRTDRSNRSAQARLIRARIYLPNPIPERHFFSVVSQSD